MSFCCRPYVNTASDVAFLMKTMQHQSKDCEVCHKQLSKPLAENPETCKPEEDFHSCPKS